MSHLLCAVFASTPQGVQHERQHDKSPSAIPNEFSYSVSCHPPRRTGPGACRLDTDLGRAPFAGSLPGGFDSEEPFWTSQIVSRTQDAI